MRISGGEFMCEVLDYDDYLNKKVEIIYTSKQNYRKLLHMIGTVERVSSGDRSEAGSG
jgi:hypothetical protein